MQRRSRHFVDCMCGAPRDRDGGGPVVSHRNRVKCNRPTKCFGCDWSRHLWRRQARIWSASSLQILLSKGAHRILVCGGVASWKSALYAAPLVILAMVFSASPMRKLVFDNAAAPGDSLGCFLLGLIMTSMFLIRGWLGLGCQYQVAQTTGRSFAEPAGLINLSVGLYGLNLTLLTLFQDWSISALAGEIFDSLGKP
ncbi:hypothetical protein SAMN05421553_0127 [Pseudomonas anguilliseptica]|uniref:Uncharacterized protein n=1 Tax=Pseudomonas anguilliseptica TaxID=53406 RepID=A0A1H4NSW3_PSEAG|nr:hypothetical protein SAMN05421553_0127 [Pseudomonas anguilliseptica]